MPDFSFEDKYSDEVVGIDEAGRGPWAGPVVAGAVVFHNRNESAWLLQELNDSKKLSAKKREKLYAMLLEEQAKGNISIGIGEACAQEIDSLNILQATFLAMKRAYQNLDKQPKFALIDGNRTPKDFPCHTQTIIKGDALSMSVAAASIVAKVYRDKLMQNLATKYPYYGFEKNAGYGTKLHMAGLEKHGICSEHRISYKPIQKYL